MTAYDYLKKLMIEAFHTTAQPCHKITLAFENARRMKSVHHRPMNVVGVTPSSATIFRN